jgi:hypothetical protein
VSSIVIACYRPKAGQEAAVRALVQTHVPRLRALDLVTDRVPIVMQARDGAILEVFEWRSQAAIDAAHRHPEVHAIWNEFAAVCEYIAPAGVAELAGLFPNFVPLN